MYDNYKLTENGLESLFQQPCKCSSEGPSKQCKEGRRLYKAMEKDSALLFDGKMTLAQADVTLSEWQTHLGA